MSYDIELVDPVTQKIIELDMPHQMAGGTYAVGGTKELSLNVTWNYARHYDMMGKKGIREIYGKSGAESIPILEAAIMLLKDDATDNYWDPTEGNAKRPLIQLLTMAKMRPDGIWEGD